jgi:glycosidase
VILGWWILPGALCRGADFRSEVIYLVMLDRFFNGDALNDFDGDAGPSSVCQPRAFHGGDLAGLKARLDYLSQLGVTTVWITPLYDQVGQLASGDTGYHGYWPAFDGGVPPRLEPKFGSDQDFKDLLNALHARNMKLILDMVVNHAGYDAPLVATKPSWFHDDDDCDNSSNRDLDCELAGLPDFDQGKSVVKQFLNDKSKAWVAAFPFDGIRMDTAKHVPVNYFQNDWIPAVESVRGDLFIVGEALYDSLDDRPTLLKPYLDAGFDSMFNFPLRRALVETFAKQRSTAIVADKMKDTIDTLGMDRTLALVNLLDNHDKPRFVNEPGFGVAEDDIRRRHQLGLAMLFTLPGIPQLYYGAELGLYGANDPDNRRTVPNWAWKESTRAGSYPGVAQPQPQQTFGFVQKCIQLRKTNAALAKGYYAELWRQSQTSQPDVYGFLRARGDDIVIVLVNNGTLPSGPVTIPLQANGGIEPQHKAKLGDGTVLTDRLGLGSGAPNVTIASGAMTVNLPAQSVGIYTIGS